MRGITLDLCDGVFRIDPAGELTGDARSRLQAKMFDLLACLDYWLDPARTARADDPPF